MSITKKSLAPKSKFFRFLSASALAITATGALSSAAQAQANNGKSASSSTTIQEVTVTARKVSEDVQKVPESITVFTSEQIAQAQIHTVDDFVAMTPNFEIHHGETAGNFQMSIRGITQADRGDAPVSMVIDGVTLPYATSFTRPLFDIDQIEVLKGPQGSLYGQNAIGGAIIIATKQPTNDLQGTIDANYGNYNSALVQGDISGPILKDKLFFRLSGSYHNDDGDADYLLYPDKSADYDRSADIRGEVKAVLTDRLTATLSLGTGIDKNNGLLFAPVSPSANSLVPGFSPAQINSSLVLNQANQDYRTVNKQTSVDGSLRLVYDAGFATLSSVTAVESLSERQLQDIDVFRVPYLYIDLDQRIRAVSEEFRISSNVHQRCRWVAGVFYLRNHRIQDLVVNGNFSLFAGNASEAAASYGGLQGTYTDQQLDSRAIFGQASYDVIKDVELTVGARYDSDPRSQVNTGYALGPAGPAPTPRTKQSTTFDQFQPKVSLKYQFLPNANVYATYAQGFRPGGFNSAANNNVSAAFPAEKTETYEAGFKSTLFEKRLILNAAAFYTNYENQQLTLIRAGANGAAVDAIYNVKQSEIKGFEISAQAKPMRGLDLGVGLGYTDATIKKFGDSLSGVQFDPASYVGKKVPLVPQFTLNTTAQYQWPLTEALDGVVRVDIETKGREYWYPDNAHSQAPYSLVNVKFGVKASNWELRVYGNNILDQKYDVLYFDNLFVSAPGGFNFAFLSNKPRYGVNLSYKF